MKTELIAAIFLMAVIVVLTTPTVSYLRDFDTWYHYRLAEYTFEQGVRPSFDPLSNLGERILYPPLLHYLIAIPAHLPGLSVMLDSQLYPPLAGIIALIFVFLFVRETFDERTAILAVLLLSLLPIFKAMTSFGFSDHDALDYVFISSTLFFFVKAIKKEEDAPLAPAPSVPRSDGQSELPKEHPRIEKPAAQKPLYYALAGISVGLFALEWEGFPMLVVLLSGSMLLCALLNSRLKLLDTEIVTGFLILSLISTGVASLWYGFDILPIFAIELASAAFSYVALRFEKSSQITIALVAVLVLSLPAAYLFRGDIINTGLIFLGLMEKGVYLKYVAELQTPNVDQFSQLYGVQLFSLILGMCLFVTSTKELKRHTVFFISCVVFFAFLAFSAIRFIEYFGIFASIMSAYLLNWVFEIINKSVKRDIFIPLMLISAALLTWQLLPFLPTMTFSVSNNWYTSLQWLKNNSNQNDVVLSWWDYSQWVNGIADRKTVVNNQPPGRFDDAMVFFGTNDWGKAKEILDKYNVSYVMVSRGTLPKIYIADAFLNQTIDFQIATPQSEGTLYRIQFGSFQTFFDLTSQLAWDQDYRGGTKTYYHEVGVFNGGLNQAQYFTANLSGVNFNDDYLFLFSDSAIRIPKDTKNRVFFTLMYENSTIPYLSLVEDSGEVRIYKVLK